MTERFSRRATWLFGIAIPVALAVVLLAPVPFMRGLGTVALACAALGAAINLAALRGATRHATSRERQEGYWPVGATLSAASPSPAIATAAARGLARRQPKLAFSRMIAIPRVAPFFPGRLPARMTSPA